MPDLLPLTGLHVVVAGAGPGGLAAAIDLRRAGAAVTVLERALPNATSFARAGAVHLPPEGVALARDLAPAAVPAALSTSMGARGTATSLRGLVDDLRRAATDGGVQVLDGVEALAQASTAGGGLQVTARDGAGQLRTFAADWFVDATGGRSQVVRAAGLELRTSGPDFAPAARDYDTATVPLAGRAGHRSLPHGAFAIPNVRDGLLDVYAPHAPADGSTRVGIDDALAYVGADRSDVVHGPRALHLEQALAPSAAAGRVLLVGDSVAHHLPASGLGTTLAMEDGRRAARLVAQVHAAPASDEATLVADYADTTRTNHLLHLD